VADSLVAAAPPRPAAGVPARAGIGLRSAHYGALLATRPELGLVEVHSENYFGAGGAPLHYLERARERYAVSLHGVGLSLGSADALDPAYLAALKRLIARIEPALVSDHLCWCSVDGRYLNDLLPLPYTEEVLAHVVERIQRVQDFLGRRILVENPSSYLRFCQSEIPEWEFLAAVAARADCEVLLDVNNVYVSSRNLGFEAADYLRALPPACVREIHLAGHMVRPLPEGELLIDTHDAPVADAVWALYREAARRFPQAQALVEWDSALPALEVLVAEARKADQMCAECADALVA